MEKNDKTLDAVRASGRGVDAPVSLGARLVRLARADDLTLDSEVHRLDGFGLVTLQRAATLCALPKDGGLALGLDDPFASSRHARLIREAEGWYASDDGSRNGTLVDGRRLAPGERRLLGDAALLEVGHTFFLFRAKARGLARQGAGSGEPLTLSPEWDLELHRALRLAAGSQEVLLLGESGAGKEVLAQLLHERSGRPGSLVAVNCGAIPEALLEDELFGHVKGAFSGAQAERRGLLRAADKGTLLLDEVGEMPASLQIKLLRVLEDRLVRPLGGEQAVKVDLRVLAATNRDLEQLVAEGKFRADLLARLGLIKVRVPALRERREDLGLLLRRTLRAAGADLAQVRFELDALSHLFLHGWPLNVRELKRSVTAALELARGGSGEVTTIALHHLPEVVRELRAGQSPFSAKERRPRSEPAPKDLSALTPEDQALREQLVALLKGTSGNTAAVARELGKPRTWVQRAMQRLGVERLPGAGEE